MDLREWKDEYHLNIDRIDEHRKKFLDIINMLIKVSNERSCEEEISLVFFRLIYFVENYFIEEESILKEHNYQKFKQHKEAHNIFIRDIIKLQDDYQNNDKKICVRLLDYLQNWFDKHILVVDKEAFKSSLLNETNS